MVTMLKTKTTNVWRCLSCTMPAPRAPEPEVIVISDDDDEPAAAPSRRTTQTTPIVKDEPPATTILTRAALSYTPPADLIMADAISLPLHTKISSVADQSVLSSPRDPSTLPTPGGKNPTAPCSTGRRTAEPIIRNPGEEADTSRLRLLLLDRAAEMYEQAARAKSHSAVHTSSIKAAKFDPLWFS
jgi:hypothetical protein